MEYIYIIPAAVGFISSFFTLASCNHLVYSKHDTINLETLPIVDVGQDELKWSNIPHYKSFGKDNVEPSGILKCNANAQICNNNRYATSSSVFNHVVSNHASNLPNCNDCKLTCGPEYTHVEVGQEFDLIVANNQKLAPASYCLRNGELLPKEPLWKYMIVATESFNHTAAPSRIQQQQQQQQQQQSQVLKYWTTIDKFPDYPVNMCKVDGLTSSENEKNVLYDYKLNEPVFQMSNKQNEIINLYEQLDPTHVDSTDGGGGGGGDFNMRYRCKCMGKTMTHQKTVGLKQIPGHCLFDPCTPGIPFPPFNIGYTAQDTNGSNGSGCNCGDFNKTKLDNIVHGNKHTPCTTNPNRDLPTTFSVVESSSKVKCSRISLHTDCWADDLNTKLDTIKTLYPCAGEIHANNNQLPHSGSIRIPNVYWLDGKQHRGLVVERFLNSL
jgi:hypothetical protein